MQAPEEKREEEAKRARDKAAEDEAERQAALAAQKAEEARLVEEARLRCGTEPTRKELLANMTQLVTDRAKTEERPKEEMWEQFDEEDAWQTREASGAEQGHGSSPSTTSAVHFCTRTSMSRST